MKELEEQTKLSMEDRLNSLTKEFKKIRTGKANVSMLDSIKVNYYGNATPLNQVSNIACPDAKSFLITPWESSVLKEIEASIVKSDLGMTPINDGKVIRLRLPDLTEERRKELVKNVKKTAEEARISVRQTRKEANDTIKTMLKDKEISEDESKVLLEDIQKITDDFIKKVDSLYADKEKDLLKI